MKRRSIMVDPTGPWAGMTVNRSRTTLPRRLRLYLYRSLLAAALLLCLAVSGARAAEAETHIFDETLSLTGDCNTGNFDSIPDPGCPGGLHPPAGPFANPSDVSTDPAGDIYVASAGPKESGGAIDSTGGHIDIFDPSGHFLTELTVPGVQHIAVDATGHLYVGAWCGGATSCEGIRLLRFDPTKYDPGTSEVEYHDPPIELQPEQESTSPNRVGGLSVNPVNQNLFVTLNRKISEFGPAIPNEPNVKQEEFGTSAKLDESFSSISVDAAHGLIYVAMTTEGRSRSVVQVLELAPPHALLRTINGSTTPAGKFIGSDGSIAVATEEATGNVFVADTRQTNKVYEFEEDGSYVGTYAKHGFESLVPGIHVDNSPVSPNEGYLFVPSGSSPPGHVFAFQPKSEPLPPVVESISITGLGEREAVMHATINPSGSATHYVFEFATEESFDQEGFGAATVADKGDLPPGLSGVGVSAAVEGLSPGTAYRFRVHVESQCQPSGCSDEAESTFTTFVALLQGGACENAELRMGYSAGLPDCRAYELVTPANTNGHLPLGPGGSGPSFGTPTMRADGTSLPFRSVGGTLPGFSGAGGFNGDAYLATRTSSGWQTLSQSPTGEQSASPSPGSLSPDLSYIAWSFGGGIGIYIRYPDGSFHLVGQGSGTADLHYIGPNGSHVLFVSTKQLLPNAPEAPTAAVYDRTADGVLHVVSLLPGDVTPGENQTAVFHEDASFKGYSESGSSVAFTVNGRAPLYVRVDNHETIEGAPGGSKFAGFSADGRYLFYVNSGDFFRFDVQSQETVEIARSGDAEPVNIPTQGPGAYFISSTKLTEEVNPVGTVAIKGQPNLYYWNGSQNQYVATVTLEDVEGTPGFAEWMPNLSKNGLGNDPARSTPQGSTLLFRSRATLTSIDAGGHAALYRYDAVENTLTCVSCGSTGLSPDSDAKLISSESEDSPFNSNFALVSNLSEDGKRAFFETSERLVSRDNDALQDVYEWEAEGKGSCRQPSGCVFLISSGQSGRANYLFGASASGDDVAFSTSDLLTADDPDETPSIYDARVEGGFPHPAAGSGECLGEACQPAAIAPPVVTPASSIFQGAGNVKGKKGCLKGTHRQRVHGKTRCVRRRRHHRRSHHHKRPTHTQGRAAR